MTVIQDLFRGLAHLFYPNLCANCGEPLLGTEDTICLLCFNQLPVTGYASYAENEAAMRLAGRIPYVHATAWAHFFDDGLLQHLLHQLKYRNRRDIGSYLGRQLGQELLQSPWGRTIDVIVPIPLHPRKESKRGYNQTTLIAEGINSVLGKTIDTRSLRRARATESQVRKTREERILNLKDAFIVATPDHLKNRHVLLVDDVLTTGATLESAAGALLEVPRIRLSIATIGLAEG